MIVVVFSVFSMLHHQSRYFWRIVEIIGPRYVIVIVLLFPACCDLYFSLSWGKCAWEQVGVSGAKKTFAIM